MANNYRRTNPNDPPLYAAYGSKRGGSQYTITVAPVIQKILHWHQKTEFEAGRGFPNRSNAIQEVMITGAKAMGFDFEAAMAELEVESKSASGPEFD